MQQRTAHNGKAADRPLVIGEPNGSPARLVETTGLVFGIHKGQQRWVTGTAVDPAIDQGLLIEIIVGHPVPTTPLAFLNAPTTTTPAATFEAVRVIEGIPTGDQRDVPPVLTGPVELIDQVRVIDLTGPGSADTEHDGDAENALDSPDDGNLVDDLANAHGIYEREAVASMNVKNTIAWVGDDPIRAQVVEARESKGQDRKTIMDHVAAVLGD